MNGVGALGALGAGLVVLAVLVPSGLALMGAWWCAGRLARLARRR